MQTSETVTITKAEYERFLNMEFQLAQLQQLVFGRKSERFVGQVPTSDQPTLFSVMEPPAVLVEEEKKTITYERAKRRGVEKLHPGRNELPASLPREEIVLEPEEDTSDMVCIGEDVTEELEHIPGKLFVRIYRRRRYARRGGEGVVQAKLPPRPIDKCIAGAGLLTQVICDKYVDHLPLYRQAKRYEREGMRIPDSTLGDWLRQSLRLLEVIYLKIREKVLESAYLMGDETTIKVLESLKKGSTHLGYFWVYYAPESKLPLFIYQPGRGAAYPKKDLADYKGYLQSDGYDAYDKLVQEYPHITLVNCWAHARRYFEKALEVDRKNAEIALGLIQELYAVERHCRQLGLSNEKRLELRQKQAVPTLKKLKEVLEHFQLTLPPKHPLAVAASYSLNRWDNLTLYTKVGLLEIDNNPVENAIRPVAVGRKNYLFAGSHESAQRAAMAYTILAACKAAEINPLEYLTDVLKTLPTRKVNDLDDLLPNAWAEKNMAQREVG